MSQNVSVSVGSSQKMLSAGSNKGQHVAPLRQRWTFEETICDLLELVGGGRWMLWEPFFKSSCSLVNSTLRVWRKSQHLESLFFFKLFHCHYRGRPSFHLPNARICFLWAKCPPYTQTPLLSTARRHGEMGRQVSITNPHTVLRTSYRRNLQPARSRGDQLAYEPINLKL